VLIKFLEVTGMGHAWSGGSSSGTYADPKGPDARHHLPRACSPPFVLSHAQLTNSLFQPATAL
jgi:hypothetical protein